MNQDILNKMKIARSEDSRKMTISDKFVKLMEEIGEISRAHSKELGHKKREPGESMQDVRKNKKEEYADALIVILDMILADKFTFEEVTEEMHNGIDKWYSNTINA